MGGPRRMKTAGFTLAEPAAEALEGSRPGDFRKDRGGDYRIISRIEDGALRILVVNSGNRREGYRSRRWRRHQPPRSGSVVSPQVAGRVPGRKPPSACASRAGAGCGQRPAFARSAQARIGARTEGAQTHRFARTPAKTRRAAARALDCAGGGSGRYFGHAG